MTRLAGWLTALGWSRDDAKWFWAQLLSGATMITTGALNVALVADYIGVHVSDVAVHRIVACCVVVLWLAGKAQTSPLFGKGNLPPKIKPFRGDEMGVPTWLRLVFKYAPLVLEMNPKTAAIAGAVQDGIAAAEMIPGADGAAKKASVLQVASDAIASINNQAGKEVLHPADTIAATSSAVDTIVSVANAVHAHATVVDGVLASQG